ncbi:5'-nucleotidase C-terminal domain-containing protein [Psychroserpens sp. SPM9]|uniref:5'-nucleotidase C-terminal domain-containing protein n=1 Tax=Psychroserpens sp. SPM9 TaxID=2975598 RepID=UPI0021A8E6C9|nr:5'-nucleotidase [Psychroserpens sp. SPM9]MDG5491705.1 5'-nucleotidase [Psychroserpens sp. SPM9]
MNYKHSLFLICLLIFCSCKQEVHLYKIEGQQINISDSLTSSSEIEDFIKPYRDNVNKNLDSILAYAVDTYSKSDGEYNTAIGNMMADAVYEEANPVFKSRTGEDIDFVLLNHGGIRAIISKGSVTTRTAYEIMPFENSTVVVKLKGEQVQELIDYLVKAKRAHPISKLNIVLDADGNLESAGLNGKPIDFTKTYNVATNDYLYNGGDRMDFFKTNDSLYVLDYKIRNVLIDYFKKTDTLNPVIDNRFIQLNN